MQTHMQAAAAAVTFYDNIWCDYCKLCPQQQQQEPAQRLVALDEVLTGGKTAETSVFPGLEN